MLLHRANFFARALWDLYGMIICDLCLIFVLFDIFFGFFTYMHTNFDALI